MYRTENLALVTKDLEWIASYKGFGNSQGMTRYAIAVWPATDRGSGQRIYWVGIQVYMGAWAEFISDNLTDGIFHKDEWKIAVAPACRGVD